MEPTTAPAMVPPLTELEELDESVEPVLVADAAVVWPVAVLDAAVVVASV